MNGKIFYYPVTRLRLFYMSKPLQADHILCEEETGWPTSFKPANYQIGPGNFGSNQQGRMFSLDPM
jgi:hypothetical protein